MSSRVARLRFVVAGRMAIQARTSIHPNLTPSYSASFSLPRRWQLESPPAPDPSAPIAHSAARATVRAAPAAALPKTHGPDCRSAPAVSVLLLRATPPAGASPSNIHSASSQPALLIPLPFRPLHLTTHLPAGQCAKMPAGDILSETS